MKWPHQLRHLVIKEMLGRTTDLFNKIIGGNAVEVDTARRNRAGPLFMLGGNYRWSPIVIIDEQENRDMVTAVKDPYGVEIRGLEARDRALDAPWLKNSAAAAPVCACSTSPHRARFIRVHDAVREQLSRYPQGLASCAAVVHGGVLGAAKKMIFTKGHAYTAYNFNRRCDIAIVKPDGVLGGVVRSPEAVGRYFSQIFA
ncbi:hypothetical protein K438DRAFT_1979971 [Mycena galopus ATCC 62051]|nr:hypothetical protein K438DRAFT_1979971 [Mycena galopus ATCC 62051]